MVLVCCRVIRRIFQPLRDFYIQMTDPRYNVVKDVYAKMFAADFVAFLVIVFGYS